MKGVILAGGSGSRLYPLTRVTNKHLLPVGKEPMIFNPIRQVLSAGITDILVVTGKEHIGEIARLLGSGRDWGCDFTFRVQEEALGIAHALSLAERFAAGECVTVILGDNIATHSIRPFVEKFKIDSQGARVLLRPVQHPQQFGIAVLDDELNIVEIEEKPAFPRSGYAVAGIYMYDARVFEFIRQIEPSAAGEYEITAVNNLYIKQSKLFYDILPGQWIDAGTFESLAEANRMMLAVNNQIISEDIKSAPD